jgi:hypothetical protein
MRIGVMELSRGGRVEGGEETSRAVGGEAAEEGGKLRGGEEAERASMERDEGGDRERE